MNWSLLQTFNPAASFRVDTGLVIQRHTRPEKGGDGGAQGGWGDRKGQMGTGRPFQIHMRETSTSATGTVNIWTPWSLIGTFNQGP